jgi:hypothetical protein
LGTWWRNPALSMPHAGGLLHGRVAYGCAPYSTRHVRADRPTSRRGAWPPMSQQPAPRARYGPAPVRGERTAVLHRRCAEICQRFALTANRQEKEIVAGVRSNLAMEQVTSVSRPVEWELVLLRSDQQCIVALAAHLLLIEIEDPAARRIPDDTLAAGRPQAQDVAFCIKGETRRRLRRVIND